MARKNTKKPPQPSQPAQIPQPVDPPPPQKEQSTPKPADLPQSNQTPSQRPKSSMAPSNRARLLWKTFESWAKEQHLSLDKDIQELTNTMDTLWRSTPKQHRESQPEFTKRKTERRREKEIAFYDELRTEWQKRLDGAGLKDEDWNDITEEEGMAVMKLLGGDVELDEEPIVINEAATQPVAPSPLSGSSRSTNISLDYDIVSPSTFRSEPDDERGFDFFDLTSVTDDTNSEASASNPWSWESEASGYNTVNTETPQSSSHSSPKLSPDALGGYLKIPPNYLSHHFSHPLPKASEKKKKGRYIGPELVDHDDQPHDDEADFASFKMEMRILKIREFHAAAAEADIALALDVVGIQSKADIHEKVLAHQNQMLVLQERKEVERKALVEAERQKRKKAIRERSSTHRVVPTVSRPNLFGESDTQDPTPAIQPQKEAKPGRRKKVTTTDETTPKKAPVSQDTVRLKVPSSTEREEDWNPFDYDINVLLATIPESMAPPVGSFPSTSLGTEPTGAVKPPPRPVPSSRTSSSTSQINSHEFWVPPSRPSDVKQAPVATQTSRVSSSQTTVKSEAPIPFLSESLTTSLSQQSDLQSRGASSSRTTLEDLPSTDPRSFWPPSTVNRSSSNISTQNNRHEIWIPPGQGSNGTTRTAPTSSAPRRQPEPSVIPQRSSQIEKAGSMSQETLSSANDDKSAASNATAPSEANRPPTGSSKKGKTAKGANQKSKAKGVTIEVIPDEEDGGIDNLPSDSKHIMEPKPVVPPAMFDHILDYEESPEPTMPGTVNWDKVLQDKAVKTKQVRWTPSVVGGSPVTIPDENADRSKWMKGDKPAADKKGKGRIVDSGDDLSRFAREAIAGLKKMSGKGL